MSESNVHNRRKADSLTPCSSIPFKDMGKVDETIAAFLEEASQPGFSSNVNRLRAANQWRTFARLFHHQSAMKAHETALSLLDIAVSGTPSLEKRFAQLSTNQIVNDARGVASDAAAFAVGQGDLPLAVTLLEQGRMILFTQLRRYRTSLDDVRALAPELAEKFAHLGHELDQALVSTPGIKDETLQVISEDPASK